MSPSRGSDDDPFVVKLLQADALIHPPVDPEHPLQDEASIDFPVSDTQTILLRIPQELVVVTDLSLQLLFITDEAFRSKQKYKFEDWWYTALNLQSGKSETVTFVQNFDETQQWIHDRTALGQIRPNSRECRSRGWIYATKDGV